MLQHELPKVPDTPSPIQSKEVMHQLKKWSFRISIAYVLLGQNPVQRDAGEDAGGTQGRHPQRE
jgi:hypothetical protein